MLYGSIQSALFFGRERANETLMNAYHHKTMQTHRSDSPFSSLSLLRALCAAFGFPRASINGNKLIKNIKRVQWIGENLLYHIRAAFAGTSSPLFFFVKAYNGTSETVHTIGGNRCRASHVVMCTLVFATLFFNDFHLCD